MFNTVLPIVVKKKKEIICCIWVWWLMPEFLATGKVEIRRIVVGGQPGQIARETPSPKHPEQMDWRSGSSSRLASRKPRVQIPVPPNTKTAG
jgi:hypothetical protein